jgi:oligopeptide transport system substrate-binding protein
MKWHHSSPSRIIGCFLSVAVSISLVACGSGGNNGSQAGSGKGGKSHGGSNLPTLRWLGLVGTATWANTLDPSQVTDSISIGVIQLVDANLVKLATSGEPTGDLASSWTVGDNGKQYTFHLRPGLKFSNGDPITANDAAWSITRALSKSTKSPVAMSYLGHILGAAAYNSGNASSVSGLKVINPTTLQITLDEPIAFFLKTLSYPTADVLDPKVLTGKSPLTYLTNDCSGNVAAGPFKFVCQNNSTKQTSFYPSGETHSMTLVPNPNYYGNKPHIRIVMDAIPDTQTNYRDYQAGSIDATAVPSADVAQNRNSPNLLTYPTSVTDYITPNEASPPFNNVHCRLALAYAIDRNAIDNEILHKTEAPIYDVVPRGMLGYYNGANNPHYDVAKAKHELAQCPGGLPNVTLPYQHTSSDVDNEYQAIQNMWNQVGIHTTLAPKTFNQWLGIVGTSLQKTNTQVTENLWIEDYPDPYDYCSLLLRAGMNYDIGDFNNPTYNKLVDKAAVESNETTRAQMYEKAQHIALSQGAWISVGNGVAYDLISSKVHGFVGSEAYSEPVPVDDDWSKVTIS